MEIPKDVAETFSRILQAMPDGTLPCGCVVASEKHDDGGQSKSVTVCREHSMKAIRAMS